jgi:hypothetical protein
VNNTMGDMFGELLNSELERPGDSVYLGRKRPFLARSLGKRGVIASADVVPLKRK